MACFQNIAIFMAGVCVGAIIGWVGCALCTMSKTERDW